MKVEHRAWDQLPREEKLNLYLLQAEWVVFLALLQGVVVDQRSMRAIVEARRLARGGTEREKLIIQIKEDATVAYYSTAQNGECDYRGEAIWDYEKKIGATAVAYICMRVINDTYLGLDISKTWDSMERAMEYYVTSISGSIKDGPLVRWLSENILA